MCRTCPLLHRTDICGVVQRLPRRVSVPQAQVRFLPPLLMKFTAMKILTLIIKQKWFDAILSGEKTVETREVRPTNTKYISYRDNNTGKVYKKDSDVPESAWDSEKGVDTVINHYDAIQFWVGYEKNRPGALVEVKGVELVDVCDESCRSCTRHSRRLWHGNRLIMTPIDHANEVIASVRQKTDRAILFYSCGKDSEVLLDLMAPHFKEIVCVFMYFVKGLDHIDNYLRAVKARYANVTILQVPHWTLTRVLRCGLYCIPNPNVKLLSLKDVDESVRMKTGISYSFYGMKQSDGMNRCLMLRGYENEAISNTNKVYPLSKWKKSDVMAYIKAKKLPEPISYNKNKSQGLTFLPEVFDYLRRHYPQDLEKIYKVFPLSRNILLRYDEEKRAAAQIQAK